MAAARTAGSGLRCASVRAGMALCLGTAQAQPERGRKAQPGIDVPKCRHHRRLAHRPHHGQDRPIPGLRANEQPGYRPSSASKNALPTAGLSLPVSASANTTAARTEGFGFVSQAHKVGNGPCTNPDQGRNGRCLRFVVGQSFQQCVPGWLTAPPKIAKRASCDFADMAILIVQGRLQGRHGRLSSTPPMLLRPAPARQRRAHALFFKARDNASTAAGPMLTSAITAWTGNRTGLIQDPGQIRDGVPGGRADFSQGRVARPALCTGSSLIAQCQPQCRDGKAGVRPDTSQGTGSFQADLGPRARNAAINASRAGVPILARASPAARRTRVWGSSPATRRS